MTAKKATKKKAPAKKTVVKKTGLALANEKRAKDKAKADAKLVLVHAQVEKDLKPVAAKANAAIEKAQVAETRSDDLRLTAATLVAEAKEKCSSTSYPWKKWVEANIKFSLAEATRLAKIGAAPEPAVALADYRASQAAHEKARRAKAKEVAKPTKTTRGVVASDPRGSSTSRPATQMETLSATLGNMEQGAAEQALASEANKMGLSVVATDAYKAMVKDAATVTKMPNPVSLLKLFNAMVPSDQMTFLTSAAEEVGAEITFPFVEEALAGATKASDAEIPEFLKRKKSKGTGKAVGEAVQHSE